MKAVQEIRWIGDADFQKSNPITAKISGLVIAEMKGKEDRRLQFEVTGGELRQMSVWGDNWNVLVEIDGETDNWNGKMIQILQEDMVGEPGKKIRTIKSISK